LHLDNTYTGGQIQVDSDTTPETLTIEVSGNVNIDINDNSHAALETNDFNTVIIKKASAGSLTLKNTLYDGLGIYGNLCTLVIDQGLTLTATGNDNTYSCAGIWCDGAIQITPGANITASATGGIAGRCVYGIYANGYLTVEDSVIKASGSSNVAAATGIGLNGYAWIYGSEVTASGSSQSDAGIGIYTNNLGNVTPAIGITDYSGAPSNVTAEGKGPEGYGLFTVNDEVRINNTSTVKAIAHGGGYSIKAPKIDGGSAKVSLVADDDAHYYPAATNVSSMDPNVKKSKPNSGSSGSGGGGCDSGFGVIGMVALGGVMAWRKRK
jgi:hypothetical protein